MEWLSRWIGGLGNVLVQFGVPEAYSLSAAWILVYLLATLLILLTILALFRLSRRGPGAPPKQEKPSPGSGDHAAVTEAAEKKVATAEEVPRAPVPSAEQIKAPASLLERMRSGLAKTHSSLVGRLDALIGSRSKIDEELLAELEEILVSADFGVKTTQDLMRSLEKRLARSEDANPARLRLWLKEEIRERLRLEVAPLDTEKAAPFVIMVVGVNGVGKTTTIGKLAWQFSRAGKKVVLGAGDTFRAAAAEQLAIWGERSGTEIVRHAEGGDPAAVAFDSAKAAVARRADILILDTAGRLHTKVNLMEELKKVRRVLDREVSGAPHETLLVLDATTGQNALVQARLFKEAVTVSGIILTKLDGTARGGMVVAIGSELDLPVRFIGIGEGLEDLRPFDPDLFVDALFPDSGTA